jgi:hypothetical protein
MTIIAKIRKALFGLDSSKVSSNQTPDLFLKVGIVSIIVSLVTGLAVLLICRGLGVAQFYATLIGFAVSLAVLFPMLNQGFKLISQYVEMIQQEPDDAEDD